MLLHSAHKGGIWTEGFNSIFVRKVDINWLFWTSCGAAGELLLWKRTWCVLVYYSSTGILDPVCFLDDKSLLYGSTHLTRSSLAKIEMSTSLGLQPEMKQFYIHVLYWRTPNSPPQSPSPDLFPNTNLSDIKLHPQPTIIFNGAPEKWMLPRSLRVEKVVSQPLEYSIKYLGTKFVSLVTPFESWRCNPKADW